MTRRAFLLWIACILAWTVVVGPIILGWATADGAAFVVSISNTSRLFVSLLSVWMLFFPAFRFVARQRLRRRRENLLMASLPGLMALISLVIVFVPALIEIFTGAMLLSVLLNGPYAPFVALGFLLPACLGFLLIPVVLIDCLLPDRIVEDDKVFD